jgi:hypothetical protein
MHIPILNIAKIAVWFYHTHVVEHEATPGNLDGLPFELDTGYAQCERQAEAIYQHNA